MHANLQSFVDNRIKRGGGTQTIVDPKTSQIGGTLCSADLEELIRTAIQHNASVQLIAGVLTVKTN